jgi:hypothetical protein
MQMRITQWVQQRYDSLGVQQAPFSSRLFICFLFGADSKACLSGFDAFKAVAIAPSSPSSWNRGMMM